MYLFIKKNLNNLFLDYCRSIEFEENVTIDDNEYVQIYGESFWHEIKSDFMRNCLICNKINPEENIFILNETETYCKNCIIDEVNLKTNNLIILNEIEKSK